jgi:hypothetical protein
MNVRAASSMNTSWLKSFVKMRAAAHKVPIFADALRLPSSTL